MSASDIVETVRSLWGLWLMALFLGIVGYAYWPRNKARLEMHGHMPLRDDDNQER